MWEPERFVGAAGMPAPAPGGEEALCFQAIRLPVE